MYINGKRAFKHTLPRVRVATAVSRVHDDVVYFLRGEALLIYCRGRVRERETNDADIVPLS